MWVKEVADMQETMHIRKGKGWFVGYNSNVEGHEGPTGRYLVYRGGAPKYLKQITDVADDGYKDQQFA
jgi:hypothetical protein